MKLSTETIRNITQHSFDKTEMKLHGKSYYKYVLKGEARINGLKIILIDLSRKEVMIEISGKILKERYFEKINKDNILHIFEDILVHHIVFNENDFLTAKVSSVDITEDLELEKEIKFYINLINIASNRVSNNFTIVSYKNKKSIAVKRRVESYVERIIFYDKGYELNMSKNSHFQPFLYQNYKANNLLRLELKLEKRGAFKKYFGKSQLTLSDIIESSKTPLLQLFDEIVNLKHLKRNKIIKHKTEIKEAKYMNIMKTLEQCNNNLDVVKSFYETNFPDVGRRTITNYVNRAKVVLENQVCSELSREAVYLEELRGKLDNE